MILLMLMLAKIVCPNPTPMNKGSESGILSETVKTSYIKETFETWPPSTFTLSPSTGTGAWLQSPVVSADYISPSAGASGEHAAEFDSWDYSSGVTGDMISEPIDLSTATSPVLSFYFWNHTDLTGYGNSDYVLVHISNDNGTTWTLIDSLYGDVDNWTLHSYDLSPYIGDTVIVRFRGFSDYGGSNMGIDEVTLGQTPDYDAAITEIIKPAEYDSVHTMTPQVVVSSEGLNELTNFYVYAEVSYSGAVVYKDSVFIPSIPSGSIDTVVFSQFTPDSGYFYDFLFYTTYPGDGFTQNDSMYIRSRFYYSDRVVVGELITNTGCAPCQPANDTLDNIFPDYPDRLTLIRYHCWWPSNTDPFYTYNQAQNTDRVNYYGADYAPHLHIDGIVDGGSSRDNWRGMFISEFNKKSPVEMFVSGSYDPEAGNGELNINIEFTGEPTDSMLKLRVALVENGIRYNAPNGQTVFYQVFRNMYPDVSGTSIDFNSIGQVTNVSVPFSIDAATFNEDSLEFIVFIQSDVTGEVLQGAKLSFSSLTEIFEHTNSVSHGFTISYVKSVTNSVLELVAILPEKGKVVLSVYDLSGRVVAKTSYHGTAGSHKIKMHVENLHRGIYFIEGKYMTKTVVNKFAVVR